MKYFKLISLLCLVLLIVCCFAACDSTGKKNDNKDGSSSNNGTDSQACTHEYTETKTDATCTKAGSVVKKCSKCGDEQTTTIPMLAHDYKDVVTAATCKADGKIESKCSACQKVDSTTKIPKNAHTYASTGSTSCKCSACNTTYSWDSSFEQKLEFDEIREGGQIIGYEITEYLNTSSWPNNIKIPAMHEGKPVLRIDDRVFAEDGTTKRDRIMSVVIPDTVTELGDGVFSWCRNLESVTIPSSLTRIGSNPFTGTKYMTNACMAYGHNNTAYQNKDFVINGIYLIEPLIEGAEEYTVAEGIVLIADNAFPSLGCSNLKTVTLPKTLKYLGTYVFESCNALETLNIHKGLIAFGENPLGAHNNNHIKFKYLNFEGTQAEWNQIKNNNFLYSEKLNVNQKIG